jgi:hypothetical protein
VPAAAEGEHRPRPRHRGRIRRDVRGRVRGRGIGTYGALEWSLDLAVFLLCSPKFISRAKYTPENMKAYHNS